jgi:spore germination protein YaaH
MGLLCAGLLFAQLEPEQKSIHQREAELHAADVPNHAVEKAIARPRALQKRSPNKLSRMVYGWQPYWTVSSYTSYDYTVLSHIAYFSYDVDTATGSYSSVHGWDTSPIIDYAHQRGVKVMLTIVNFNSAPNTKILSDTNKQNRLITDIIQMLLLRDGDGVNIDFEAVPAAMRTNLVSFMRKLSTRVKAVIPSAEISMASPAVAWSGSWATTAWDLAALSQICDYLILMGYNYYWSGSSTAGPVAPLQGGSYNITNSIISYLNAGVPPQKLLLGVPWYGIDWPVRDSRRMSDTIGTGSSRTYANAEPLAQAYGKNFDATYKVPWYTYKIDTIWRQCWYDDSTSLAMKNAYVNSNNLTGIGIWALGHEGGRKEIWNGLKASFPLVSVYKNELAAGQFRIDQNFPNPFNPSTEIGFSLDRTSNVRLEVFDVLGRSIAVLANENMEPGYHRLVWNATRESGGVYFCRLTAAGSMRTIKMQLLR